MKKIAFILGLALVCIVFSNPINPIKCTKEFNELRKEFSQIMQHISSPGFNIPYLVERTGAVVDIWENITNYCTILKEHKFVDYLPCT